VAPGASFTLPLAEKYGVDGQCQAVDRQLERAEIPVITERDGRGRIGR
jgi:hypothetical protein